MKPPQAPPPIEPVLVSLTERSRERFFMSATEPAPDRSYRHWDVLRHMTPPEGLTKEQYWAAIKLARRQGRRALPLKDPAGRPFSFITPDHLWEMLHQIDQNASGAIQVPEPITNPATRDRYLQSTLIEEALTSSQIEGAVATREQAKDLIRGNRKPASRHERMVYNNYQALSAIRDLVAEPLTPALIGRIHSIITADTMDEKFQPPFLRTEGDGIAIRDDEGMVWYEPPPAREIPTRMKALCAFANQEKSGRFLHPVIKAILLHFWLAVDHPFVDGNGRTARALFYWSMLKDGYWLTEFLSISSIIKKGQGKYSEAFLHAESDDCDATYFLDHQLRVILRAVESLHAYLARKVLEVRGTERLLRQMDGVNHRQLALLSHALRHPGERYTIQSHQRSHRVSYQTARTDLIGLGEARLLEPGRSGNRMIFSAPVDLASRLRRTGSRRKNL
jgi:Fic family protein